MPSWFENAWKWLGDWHVISTKVNKLGCFVHTIYVWLPLNTYFFLWPFAWSPQYTFPSSTVFIDTVQVGIDTGIEPPGPLAIPSLSLSWRWIGRLGKKRNELSASEGRAAKYESLVTLGAVVSLCGLPSGSSDSAESKSSGTSTRSASSSMWFGIVNFALQKPRKNKVSSCAF